MQVRAEKECFATDYLRVRKGNQSLLELAIGEDASVCRITLLLCSEFGKTDASYQIPDKHENGDVFVESSGEVEASVFFCRIYQNAIKIIVSDLPVHTCVVSDSVVWELAANGDLTSVCVIDPTGHASEHCITELQAN